MSLERENCTSYKFTVSYGEEVHRFMCDEGFAPQLLMPVKKLQDGLVSSRHGIYHWYKSIKRRSR